jgi:hypothetical protein
LLMSELPLSDGDLTYLVSVVGVSDEILCAVGSRQAARTLWLTGPHPRLRASLRTETPGYHSGFVVKLNFNRWCVISTSDH